MYCYIRFCYWFYISERTEQKGGGAFVAVTVAALQGGGGDEKVIDHNPLDNDPCVVDDASMHGGRDPYPLEPVVVVAVVVAAPPQGTTVRPSRHLPWCPRCCHCPLTDDLGTTDPSFLLLFHHLGQKQQHRHKFIDCLFQFLKW